MAHIELTTWLVLALLAAAVLLWPGVGLRAVWRRRRARQRRWLVEDALKHVLAWEHRGQDATPESLAGALGRPQSRVSRLIAYMQARGLLQLLGSGLRLTPEGERWAVHVVRAHRLWERYLADDAGVPMGRLHQAAEIAEHRLSAETLDALEAHLGHPERDPHGDPIPAADGSFAPLQAVPLSDWTEGKAGRIVHIEDEPDVVFQQIVAAGLRPGVAVRVLERTPARLVVSDGENEHRLAPIVAANIQVAAVGPETALPAGTRRLWDLRTGEAAEVVEIDQHARGFSRRRLLDLGLTPQARVEAALDNAFGDPRGFRVRGTLIALRKQQADHVWVRPLRAKQAAPTAGARPS